MITIKLIPKIKERRMEAHLSQIELAEKTGISKTRLSLIESGKAYPNTITLFKIAEGIGCKTDQLYEVLK